ncbi:hypothetical protein Q9Q99_10455 [Curtobacterium flaccumfaciens]|nr:hypothetical protein Q9Q99_10455 [Curtobacterium flaccumfaciens]
MTIVAAARSTTPEPDLQSEPDTALASLLLGPGTLGSLAGGFTALVPRGAGSTLGAVVHRCVVLLIGVRSAFPCSADGPGDCSGALWEAADQGGKHWRTRVNSCCMKLDSRRRLSGALHGHTASLGSSGTYLPVKEGPNAHGVRHL